jgi:hypothetical protein
MAVSSMPIDVEKVFPRDVYGRIALALASVILGPVFGFLAVVCLFAEARPNVLGRLFLLIFEELFIALSIFFACGLIWAMATPRWMECVLTAIVGKLAIALGLFAIPAGLFAAWVLLVG